MTSPQAHLRVETAHLDLHGLVVSPLQENCYVVIERDSRRAIVVDPGDEADVISAVIDEEGATLTAIWLTHGHVDHVGAVGPLVERYGVPVLLHEADLPLYERAAATGRLYGMLFDQPPSPNEFVREGDVVKCGTTPFEVLHLPGHSPGQVAFVGDGVCFSGDVLFAGSIGRTDLPLSDPRAMHQSLLRMMTLPGELSRR